MSRSLSLTAAILVLAASLDSPAQSQKVDGWSEPLRWTALKKDDPVPRAALVGGDEGGRPLYVCRAPYAGGLHPGKVVSGSCNIGYGGKEVGLDRFEVALDARGRWVPADRGLDAAVVGGREGDRPLLLCRAPFQGGTHPGKVVGARCNFGYGGKEVISGQYDIYVLDDRGRDDRTDPGWDDRGAPPSGGSPLTICSDQPLPRGAVIIKMGRDMKCPGWTATGFNTQTIKRPGESEEICGNSPVPRGWVVESEGLSWDCPNWTAIGKNTKKIRRF